MSDRVAVGGISRIVPGRGAVAAVCALLVVAGAVAAIGPAAAATETGLALVPVDDDEIDPGGSTTYALVLDRVEGGVGAYIVDVAVADPSTATITDASDGIDGNARVEFDDDNSSVRIGAFAGNATDTGTDVVIASVTVTGQAPGTTDLSVDPESLSDEEDTDRYTITDIEGAAVAVEGETTAGTPTTETPTTETPTAGTPTAGTPTAGTPTAGTPTTETPTTETPTAGTPTAGTPTAGTPTAGTPSTGGGNGGGGTTVTTAATGTTTTDSPGFGPTHAAVAALVAALLSLRRRRGH